MSRAAADHWLWPTKEAWCWYNGIPRRGGTMSETHNPATSLQDAQDEMDYYDEVDEAWERERERRREARDAAWERSNLDQGPGTGDKG